MPDFAGLNSPLIRHFLQIPLFALSRHPYLSKILQDMVEFHLQPLKTRGNKLLKKRKKDTDRAEKVNPLDTGYKLDVDKTLRIHVGRLLSVLYMFNLRPVPREGLWSNYFCL